MAFISIGSMASSFTACQTSHSGSHTSVPAFMTACFNEKELSKQAFTVLIASPPDRQPGKDRERCPA